MPHFSAEVINTHNPSIQIDALGLHCPLPLLKLKQGLHQASIQQNIYILTSDKNSPKDILRYCQRAGHEMCLQEFNDTICHMIVRKAFK